MAKRAKKGFNLKEYSKDVTINDFANSSVPKTGRVKKNEINKVISQVKNLSVAEKDQSWDEKLTYLDGISVKNKNGKTLKKKGKKEKKNTSPLDENNVTQYKIYPLELWFKVSEYITPEDVGRFASICRDTLFVVSCARFWNSLYKRHYKEVPGLPELLQPKCIVRRYGLRTNVIRALYFMYPPFVNKIKSKVVLIADPHSLVKRVCVLSWSQKKKGQWIFYFKLKNSQLVNSEREQIEDEEKPGLLEMLEDISANVDDGCKMLEVKNMNYVLLPMILGQRLNSVSLKLNQDFLSYRLELNFGCGTSPHMGSNYVTLDSVVKVRVLDWWDPSFPRSNGLNCPSYSNESNYLMDEIDMN